MRRYFKNLLIALLGRNPYQIELDEVKEKYEAAAENVNSLNDMYYKLLEKMDYAEKWIADYQRIIENLRERIKEKEEMLSQQDRDYRASLDEYEKRIKAYKVKIDVKEALRGCERP